MQGHPDPARLVGEVALVNLAGNATGHFLIHMKKEVSVGAGAGTSSPGLNPVTVIEQLNRQVEMQIVYIE